MENEKPLTETLPEDRQTGTTTARNNEWTAERLQGFWAAMGGLYGSRWYKEHGADINSPACTIWRNELLTMSPEEAAMGWRACKRSGDEFPCTMPQFTKRVLDAICARKRPNVHKALPEPGTKRKERAATAAEYLKDARGKLKK